MMHDWQQETRNRNSVTHCWKLSFVNNVSIVSSVSVVSIKKRPGDRGGNPTYIQRTLSMITFVLLLYCRANLHCFLEDNPSLDT